MLSEFQISRILTLFAYFNSPFIRGVTKFRGGSIGRGWKIFKNHMAVANREGSNLKANDGDIIPKIVVVFCKVTDH